MALGLAAGTLAGVVLLVVSAYWWIFRRPLPRTRGSITVAGPAARVEIERDGRGVPHVRAQSWADLCFGQGFAHGQDRLWHLELGRRVAAGRLSEVVGGRGLDVDRLMRRIGLFRVSEAEWHVTHAAGELRTLVQAYADGVNAARRDRPLPAEFTILRHRPEPWTPEDTFAIGRLLSFSQSGNWEAQLVRMRLLKEVGADLAQALDPGVPSHSPVILRDTADARLAADGLLAALRGVDDLLDLSSWVAPLSEGQAPGAETVGSNAWAVHGSRTATGHALLANDPHSALSIPSAWYRARLSLPDWEFGGLTFSGVPFGAIGRNNHIAWGLTNAAVSIQDLYVERLNPNNPLQFLDADGTWQDAVRFRETIRVRGAAPVVEDVLVTRRGPIISPALGGQQPPLSLRWVALDSEADSLGWLLKLNRARDWQTFRAAVSSMPAPAMSVTYADTAGNIGYRLSGFLPIREPGRGLVPGRGWEMSDQWQGFLSMDEVPEVYNPPEGYIVTANNLVSARPTGLVQEPSSGLRAARIDAVLAENPSVSVEDCVKLQNDVHSILGGRVRDLVVGVVEAGAAGDDIALGSEVLGQWDLEMAAASAGALLYQEILERLQRRLLEPLLTPALLDLMLGRGVHDLFPTGPFHGRVARMVVELLEDGRVDPRRPDPQRRNALVADVLAEAVAGLAERHGRDPRRWRLGDHRTLSFDHPLAGAVAALRPIFSRGPYPAAGDGDTVRLADRGVSDGWIAPASSAFKRAVYDLGPARGDVISTVAGQSGHPGSRHYADLIQDWLAGRPHPLDFGRPPGGGDVLVLEPG